VDGGGKLPASITIRGYRDVEGAHLRRIRSERTIQQSTRRRRSTEGDRCSGTRFENRIALIKTSNQKKKEERGTYKKR